MANRFLSERLQDSDADERSSSAPLTRPARFKSQVPGRRSGSASRISRAVVQATDPVRQKDKLVPLPESVSPTASPRQTSFTSASTVSLETPFSVVAAAVSADDLTLNVSPDQLADLSSWQSDGVIQSNVCVTCVSDAFDLDMLEEKFKNRHSQYKLRKYEEVVHAHSRDGPPPGEDIFVFAYGVAVFWGLREEDTERVNRSIKSTCRGKALSTRQVERDKFQVQFTRKERPHILNDIITINRHFMYDDQVKLAISHALAQSIKLAVYEERVSSLIESTRHLPEQLAEIGHVKIDRRQLAQIIGEVYLQRSHVNLLSSVMDTPDFFWEAPDVLQEVYKALARYLELEDRIELINSRFQILGEMLDLLRDHQATHHGHSLEWIVIWLIVLEVVIGCAQIAEMFGLL